MSDIFTHLHVHSQYSIHDAMIKPKELAKRLKELGMDSIAITDHGVMHNVPTIYKALKRYGIKYIVGTEAYVAPRSNMLKEAKVDNANYHLVLLAKNEIGYKNLLKLVSDAAINGFFYKPRIDKHLLRKHSEGIIALSACLGGELLKTLMNEGYEQAKEVALEYNDIFGDGNYFIEIQDHGMEEQRVTNPQLIRLAKETGIPLVATNDAHYLYKENYEAHDLLMAISAGVHISSEKRKKYPSDEFYLKSAEEMAERFSYIPEAISNTKKIADLCTFEMELGGNKLPEFPVPDFFEGSNYEFLKKIAYDSASEKYDSITSDIKDRIEYELSTINNMGYTDYFLITWDFFRFCKEGTESYGDELIPDWDPILTGPGRGSGVGSIILYLLDVTKVEPLGLDLMFERFLDPSRVSMPDVDSDFEDRRRQEVIDYATRKYGTECTSQIISYNTMAAKSAIKSVCRTTTSFTFKEQDKITKLIPTGVDITEALETIPDFKDLYDNNEEIKKVIDLSLQIEGLPSSTGTHAAGVLITNKKGLVDSVPLHVNDAAVVAQYDKDDLEDCGLLKMDFLGLSTLGVFRVAIDNIYKNTGVKVDLEELYKADDLAPLKLLREGNTLGIFQLENDGMRSFIKDLSPVSMEDWIIGIAMYRPGPMKMIPELISNKKNPENIKYSISGLSEILDPTYGVLCYQEQCMQIVIKIAGYHKSDSDGFRRVISKKKMDIIPLHRRWFIQGRKLRDVDETGEIVDYPNEIQGGLALGHSEEELNKLFDLMEEFGKYAFNKSHAAAYAYVGYCSAYFMYYYPTEYIAACLTYAIKDQPRTFKFFNYFKELTQKEVVYPSINFSETDYQALPDGNVVYAMRPKSSSEAVINSVIKERRDNGNYLDMIDFIVRTKDFMNKTTFIGLVAVGCFDEFGIKRSEWMAGAPTLFDNCIKKIKDKEKRLLNKGKLIDFDFKEELLLRMEKACAIPNLVEYPKSVMIRLEKRYLGVYLTGHPLDRFDKAISQRTELRLGDLTSEEIDPEEFAAKFGKGTKIIVLMNDFIQKLSRSGNQIAICDVEDKTGKIKTIMYPAPFAYIKNRLSIGNVYELTGFLSCNDDGSFTFITTDIEEMLDTLNKKVVFEVDNIKDAVSIIDILKSDKHLKGKTPVAIVFNNIEVILNNDYSIDLGKSVELSREANIKMKILNY